MNANELKALTASDFWPHIYGSSICPDGHGKDQIYSNRIGMESREWVEPKLTSGQFLLSVGSVESFDDQFLVSQTLGEGVGEVSFPICPKLVFLVVRPLFIAILAMNSPMIGEKAMSLSLPIGNSVGTIVGEWMNGRGIATLGCG